MIHTSFDKGTPLLIVFRDGKRILDKFVEKTSKGFKVERIGHLFTKDIRVVAVFKGRDDRKVSLTPSK